MYEPFVAEEGNDFEKELVNKLFSSPLIYSGLDKLSEIDEVGGTCRI